MILISRSLPLALITFVIINVMGSAHAAIIDKGNLDPLHLSDHSIILDDASITNGMLNPLEATITPGSQIPPAVTVVPQLLPVNPPLNKPESDSVKPSAASVETRPETLDEPQPGPEPYVMLLIGLGMIVVAITLHLKPIQHRHSGFQPSQGMPFV